MLYYKHEETFRSAVTLRHLFEEDQLQSFDRQNINKKSISKLEFYTNSIYLPYWEVNK